MSRKTKSYPLKEFWERKLNIKYDTEIEYYKKFCGGSYKYEILFNDSDYYNNLEDITYENWKNHILKTIENLTFKELEEYLRFINQQCRNKETKLISFQSLLTPYAIGLIGGGIISPIFSIILDGNGYFFFIAVLFILYLIYLFKYFCSTHETSSNIKYFYQDIKEIVEERIELIKGNKTEE